MRPFQIVVILLFGVVDLVASSNFWIRSKDSIAASDAQVETTDLMGLITRPCGSQSKEHRKAVELLTSMQSAPTCNRVATATLLTSCQSIDGSGPNHEDTLETVKATYAAQLALCELRNAGAETPSQCKILPATASFITPDSSMNRRQLTNCLRSLESRPQWWTSYSNNAQNAVIICRAARVEIEKDSMIELTKSMITTSATVDETLSRVTEHLRQAIMDQQRFATAVQSFHDQLTKDLELSSTRARSSIADLVEATKATLQSTFGSLQSVVQPMKEDMTTMSVVVKKSQQDVTNLSSMMVQIQSMAHEGGLELGAFYRREMDASRDLATGLQDSIRVIRDEDMTELSKFFGQLRTHLISSNELLANNTATLKDNLSAAAEIGSVGGVLVSLTKWTWLYISLFALWVHDKRAGAIATAFAVTMIKLANLLFDGNLEVVVAAIGPKHRIDVIQVVQLTFVSFALLYAAWNIWMSVRYRQRTFLATLVGGAYRDTRSPRIISSTSA
ncbi:hypothetical protein MMC25_006833 [Agyrium rufum]|nr:hypothetical protein [Agyrium rufum]